MIDKYGREIDYLRISLTDRCNLRCIYCMPEEGVKSLSHAEILTYDEILRICRCAADLGIRKIKLTGGEPLVRKGCASLAKQIKAIPGIDKVTLTTMESCSPSSWMHYWMQELTPLISVWILWIRNCSKK